MSITSIIIDNQTKAIKLDSENIQLDLLAFPVDKENNMEPEQEFRLYVNNELFKTFESNTDGKIKQSLIIPNGNEESITVKLEETVSGVKSKIKLVMIEEGIETIEELQESEKNKLRKIGEEEIKFGAKFEGEIIEKKSNGVVVVIGEGISGLIHITKLDKSIYTKLQPGERINVEIIEIRREKGKILTQKLGFKAIIRKNPTNEKKEGIISVMSTRGRDLSDSKYKEYIDDFDVVMAAVKQNGLALQFASNNLRNNHDIVIAAIRQNGLALKCAADAIKDLPEICIEAVEQNVLAYDMCTDITLKNEQVLEAVFNWCWLKRIGLGDLKKISKKEKDIFELLAFSGDYGSFVNTQHQFIRNNKNLILYIIKNSPYNSIAVSLIPYISDSLKNDIETIKEIFRVTSEKIQAKHSDIYERKSIIEMIIKILPDDFKRKHATILSTYMT